MNQETLDRLIGAAPPSRVDVERIILRQRHRRRVRQLAAGGGVAVAVVVAIMLGASLTGGQRPRDLQVATAPSGVATGPDASGHAGVLLEVDSEAGRRRTLTRLRTALEDAVEKHAPGTRWISMPDAPGEKPTPDGHPTLRIDENPTGFSGRSGITADGAKGGLHLALRPVGCSAGRACSPLHVCDGADAECIVLPSGSGLQRVYWVDKPGEGRVFYGVDLVLADGVHALRLLAVNDFGDAGPVSAPVPVLTRPELHRVATEIADRITG